jgi:O-antigen/teichoic acid export membrane protein
LGTIQKQGLINTVIIYFGVALGLVNRIIVQPHFLTKSEIGLSTLLVNFSALLSTFFIFGTSNMCVRYFPLFRDAEKRHHGFFGFVLLFPLIGAIAGGVVYLLLRSWLLHRYEINAPLFTNYFDWTFPLAVVMSFAIALNSYSNSLHKTTVPSFLNDIWLRIVLVAGAIAYGASYISLNSFVAVIFVSYFTQMIFLAAYIYTIDKPGLKIDWPFVRSVGVPGILRYTFLLAITALTSLSIKSLDNVMVGSYLGEDFSGVFSIGMFIAMFIETPLYSLERIAGTKIAHAFSTNNTDEIREIYYRSVRYLFLIGGFLTVGIVTNIHDLLRLLPAGYKDAANVTILLSVGSLINMATGVNSPILFNSSRYFWGFIFLFILLVLSVVLNVFFIPVYGIAGAAIATGLASTLFNIMKFIYIRKKFGMQPYDMRTVKTLAAICLSFFTAYFIPVPANAWLAIALRGTATTLVFVGMTYFLHIIPEYEYLFTGKFRK